MHFFYDASGKVASVNYNGQRYAYLYNMQGDVVGLLDSTGAEVVKYTYDAWGKQLSKTGSLANTLGTIQPFRYRGYVYDEETGLYYLRSRYYNPTWGRFVNADVQLITEHNTIEKQRGTNLYCYCYNLPLIYWDDAGTKPTMGLVEGYGSVTEANFEYTVSVFKGECYDGHGNVADFVTYVGINPMEFMNLKEFLDSDKFSAGIGGVSVSYGQAYFCVKADSVYDIAGKGCYIGGSADVFFSIGYDALFLGKGIPEITDGVKADGGQFTVGVGAGISWVHMGNSYTYVRLKKENGVTVPPNERKWVDKEPLLN